MKSKENEEVIAGMDSGKTDEQFIIDQADALLDRTALGEANWGDIRSELAEIYAKAGKEDMAAFVDPSRA